VNLYKQKILMHKLPS